MPIPLTAREPVAFRPPALAKTHPDVVITVRVPTMLERDSYHAALVRSGVTHYTRQQVRDLMLSGIADVYPEDKVEEHQALMEELWTATDDGERVEIEQRRKLAEIQEQGEATGKPLSPEETLKQLAEIVPNVVMDRQRRIKATGITQEVVAEYEPLKNAVAALAEQDAKRAWMNAEVYVAGFTGLTHQPAGNGRGGLLPHEVEYLRGEIGNDAFQELSDFITALQGIDEDEEKNLVSLLENMSVQIGSTPSDPSPSSDDGNSTDGPSSKTLEAGSAKTTGSSSNSSTNSRRKPAARRTGRTGKRSSTSP